MTSRILVAEPSRTLTTLMRLTLSGDDLSVDFVGDGHTALAQARMTRPDLVIADAGLPGLSGYRLAEALRGEPELASTPVLLTIPDYESPDEAALRRAGVADVLTKPFERHALLERVRTLIADRVAAPPAGRRPALEAPAPVTRPLTPQPASTAAAPPDMAAVERWLADRLPGMVEDLWRDRLETALNDRLEALAGDALRSAARDAIEDALPQVVDTAAREVAPQLQEALDRRIPELVKSMAEKIVWKVVPELAEDLIREEIARLTEENGA